jgi:hypothetical protein
VNAQHGAVNLSSNPVGGILGCATSLGRGIDCFVCANMIDVMQNGNIGPMRFLPESSMELEAMIRNTSRLELQEVPTVNSATELPKRFENKRGAEKGL